MVKLCKIKNEFGEELHPKTCIQQCEGLEEELQNIKIAIGATDTKADAISATVSTNKAETDSKIADAVGRIADNETDINNINDRTIEGVKFDGSISHYAVCSTAANVAAKTVTLDGFSLSVGARVIVQFSNANRQANPTLNVSGTGAYPIMWKGANVDATALDASTVYELVYTGESWVIVGNISVKVKKPTIHGFLLDNADSNPQTRITYIGASANLTAEERMALYTEHNRHCVVKAAKVVGLVDETDWSKFEDGTPSGVADGFALDGNFMIRHDTLWWRTSMYTPTVGLVEFTWDNPHDDSFVTAHAYADGTIRTELFTGGFEGTNSTVGDTTNCLRSVYGTDDTYIPLVNITPKAAYTRARNSGVAEGLTENVNTYSNEQAITYAMLLKQWVWVYGTTDFQSNVARGIVDGTSSITNLRPCGYGMSLTGGMTQGTPATSQSYTNNVAAVYGGRVNPHGNVYEHKADVIYWYGHFAMAIKGGDHIDIGSVTTDNYNTEIPDSWYKVECAHNQAYISAILFDKYYFALPKQYGGSSTTYVADMEFRASADTPTSYSMRSMQTGGHWYYASQAGPFCFSVGRPTNFSNETIGSRLQCHGLTPINP